MVDTVGPELRSANMAAIKAKDTAPELAVLLMADALLLGSGEQNHVRLPGVDKSVILYRHKEGLAVRHSGKWTLDGRCARDPAVLGSSSTVRGEEFAFTLERASARFGQV